MEDAISRARRIREWTQKVAERFSRAVAQSRALVRYTRLQRELREWQRRRDRRSE